MASSDGGEGGRALRREGSGVAVLGFTRAAARATHALGLFSWCFSYIKQRQLGVVLINVQKSGKR
jgi:hypothetical protein